LPALCDGRPTLAQSFEVVPQVLAVGVIRDCHSEKTAGLEFAPEPLGQLGHFHRIANRLFPLVELLVASPKPVDFSFLAAQLRGLSRLPVLRRQQDKPVNGRRIGRIRHEQAFQLSAFRFNITLLGGEPGIEPMELGRHRLRGWQVRYGRI
jgi:hypothetical protein